MTRLNSPFSPHPRRFVGCVCLLLVVASTSVRAEEHESLLPLPARQEQAGHPLPVPIEPVPVEMSEIHLTLPDLPLPSHGVHVATLLGRLLGGFCPACETVSGEVPDENHSPQTQLKPIQYLPPVEQVTFHEGHPPAPPVDGKACGDTTACSKHACGKSCKPETVVGVPLEPDSHPRFNPLERFLRFQKTRRFKAVPQDDLATCQDDDNATACSSGQCKAITVVLTGTCGDCHQACQQACQLQGVAACQTGAVSASPDVSGDPACRQRACAEARCEHSGSSHPPFHTFAPPPVHPPLPPWLAEFGSPHGPVHGPVHGPMHGGVPPEYEFRGGNPYVTALPPHPGLLPPPHFRARPEVDELHDAFVEERLRTVRLEAIVEFAEAREEMMAELLNLKAENIRLEVQQQMREPLLQATAENRILQAQLELAKQRHAATEQLAQARTEQLREVAELRAELNLRQEFVGELADAYDRIAELQENLEAMQTALDRQPQRGPYPSDQLKANTDFPRDARAAQLPDYANPK